MIESPISLSAWPALTRLTRQWSVVARECGALDRTALLPIERDEKPHEAVLEEILAQPRPGWVRAWGPQRDRWLNYALGFRGTFPLGDAGCPETVALLREIEGIEVAALSLFRPGVCLPPHTHPELAEAGLLTVHLCLEAPEDHCHLWTDGRFVPHRPGSTLLFDGSREHYAFNNGDADRLVLYLEVSAEGLARA